MGYVTLALVWILGLLLVAAGYLRDLDRDRERRLHKSWLQARNRRHDDTRTH